jgi:hypothetical protein
MLESRGHKGPGGYGGPEGHGNARGTRTRSWRPSCVAGACNTYRTSTQWVRHASVRTMRIVSPTSPRTATVAENHPPLGLLNSSSSGKGSEVEACAYCDSTLSSKTVDDFDSDSEACAEPASPSFASAICSSYIAMPVSMSRNVAMCTSGTRETKTTT